MGWEGLDSKFDFEVHFVVGVSLSISRRLSIRPGLQVAAGLGFEVRFFIQIAVCVYPRRQKAGEQAWLAGGREGLDSKSSFFESSHLQYVSSKKTEGCLL